MGKIKDILQKLFAPRGTDSEHIGSKGISAEELELLSYMREEERDALRRKLAEYRLKKNREILLGNTFSDQARSVYGEINILKAKNILSQENTFSKERNLLSKKGNILNTGNLFSGGGNILSGKKKKIEL